MRRLFHNYLSNRKLFYNLFDEAAKNTVDIADLLVIAVNTGNFNDREIVFKKITKLEHTGDDITHKIYLALDQVIFTPINRGNIHTLASCIDNVADTINEASGRMYLYNIEEFVSAFKEIALLIQQASIEIQKVVNLLRVPDSKAATNEACQRIKTLERQSDKIYYHAVAELFANEKDAINLIKYREILSSLENAMNRCKNTGDALEAILINRQH
jgi:predicted phosphate transport protein (TIGR00153 family)